MCSKYDSDATYCSEVEKLLNEPAGKKSCKNWPVRRSQRLSQKHELLNNVSSDNMYITTIGKAIKIGNKINSESQDLKKNKFTKEIFTIHDLGNDQLTNYQASYDVTLKDHLSWESKYVKHVSNLNGVPLDLSKKSEVLTTETPNGLKNIKDAAVDLCSYNLKNDKESGNLQDISRRKRRNRQNKSLKMPKNSNEELDINTKHAKRKKLKKRPTKTANSQKDIIIKRFKLSKEDKETNVLQNQNKLLTIQRVLRTTSNANKLQSLNSTKVDAGINVTNVYETKIRKPLNNMQKVSCGNIETNKLQIQSRFPVDHIKSSSETKNKTAIIKSTSTPKTSKLLDEKSADLDSKTKELIESEAVKNKRVAFKQTFSKSIKETRSIKKLQKTTGSIQLKRQSVKISSKNKTQVGDLQLDLQHIKSEPYTFHDIYVEPSKANIKQKVLTKTLRSHDNRFYAPEQLGIQRTPTKDCPLSNTCSPGLTATTTTTKTLNKPNGGKAKNVNVVEGTSTYIYLNANNTRSLRRKRGTTDNTKNYKILDNNTPNKKNEISNCVNEIKKFKTEVISQKSLEQTNLKNAQEKNSGRNSNNHSGSKFYRDESKTNEFENQLPSFKKSDCNILQNNQKSNEELEAKKQVRNKNSRKNYLKSFDRSQFLEKIQNSRNYLDKLSAENNSSSKLNISQMPLTPADSTPELLKKSILPDVYPPHFKYQLPPESVHTCTLDQQPTSVITPDNTATSELLHSSSSSPSLPESLCELFQTKDIKSILNVERDSYRLNSYHIQALALMLNLRLEYLRKILDKIMNIHPTVLKNVDNVVKIPFVQDYDLFATSPNVPWASDEVVFNSQSPKQHRKEVIGVLNGGKLIILPFFV